MPFDIVGWMGPGMRQLVGFGDRSTGKGTFGGEFGVSYCNQLGFFGVRARRGPFPKLLWADLLVVVVVVVIVGLVVVVVFRLFTRCLRSTSIMFI